ncbi:hypothetical protein A2U01_0091091, partial [Trifolium medium]|nr:hypothetical protein [Trifolium medium]
MEDLKQGYPKYQAEEEEEEEIGEPQALAQELWDAPVPENFK